MPLPELAPPPSCEGVLGAGADGAGAGLAAPVSGLVAVVAALGSLAVGLAPGVAPLDDELAVLDDALAALVPWLAALVPWVAAPAAERRAAGLPRWAGALRVPPAGLRWRGGDAGGSFRATSRPENAAASVASFEALRGDAAARAAVVVLGAEPPPPAAREIKNATPNAAMASTIPVARTLTVPTA